MRREEHVRSNPAAASRPGRWWVGIVGAAIGLALLAACQGNAPSTTAPGATAPASAATTAATPAAGAASPTPAVAPTTAATAAATAASPAAGATAVATTSAAAPTTAPGGTPTSAAAATTGAATPAPTAVSATETPSTAAQSATPTAQVAPSAATPAGTPAAAAAAASPEQGGRPMFQMNAQHTGRSPYARPRKPVLLQTYQLPVPAESTPAPPPMDVQSEAAIGPDGTIYIGNFPGYLVALRRASSGDQLSMVWRFHPAGASSWHSTPAIGRDDTV